MDVDRTRVLGMGEFVNVRACDCRDLVEKVFSKIIGDLGGDDGRGEVAFP